MAHIPCIRTLKLRTLTLGLALTLGFVSASANAAVLLSEGFESPLIPIEGDITTTLPAGWQTYAGTPALWRPGSLADDPGPLQRWSQSEPLAAPAGGNQVLFLNNFTGISRNVGAIQPQTVYELSAAIGIDQLILDPNSWGIFLFADTNEDGVFSFGDERIVDQYGGSGTETTPPFGGWALNSVSFDSALASPTILGKNLLVGLYNTGNFNSTATFDNVTLTAVPEPSSLLLAGMAAAAALVANCRVRRHAAK